MIDKTLALWWRFGKEHGETDLRVNAPATIAQHLDDKATHARQTPATEWRWWTNGTVIVEKPTPGLHYKEDTRIYYLIARGVTVIEQILLPPPRSQWTWYIHLADIFYDEQRCCWISKDLFCDILLDHTGQYYHLLDLGDLGHALAIGLITPAETTTILQRTDALLSAVAARQFPFAEIEQARLLCRQLGWK